MQTKLIIARIAVLWVAVSLAGIAGLSSALAQSGSVAVVVNDKNPVTNVTISELRKLFTGQKHSWTGGMSVILFVRAPGADERVVLLRLLGMSEIEYKRFWSGQVFRGEAMAEPVALFSNGMQKEALASFAGRGALVNSQDVKPGMKIVKVDGHMPGEAAYPLN